MLIDKFEFEQIGWNGSLQSIWDLLSELIHYRLDPKFKPPDKYIDLKSDFESSDILSKWQKSRQDAPVFKLFQTKYETFNDAAFTDLDMEIQEKGLLLAKGQVLFRGVCSENHNYDYPSSFISMA